MPNGLIVQVKGLGVPVQMLSERNHSGYEVRWSSDPEVPASADVHVLIGHDELQRFMGLAVDSRFMAADLITLTPVVVEDGCTSVSRQKAVQAGVNPESLNMLRVALVVSGNASLGSVMDEIEWIGSREEYAQGDHLREGRMHAMHRGIKAPSIFPHTESGPVLRAAEFISDFRRQMKPSLHATETLTRILETNLCELDLHSINPDRAVHYLREIQRAFIQHREQQSLEGMDSGKLAPEVKAPAVADECEAPLAATRSRGPRLG